MQAHEAGLGIVYCCGENEKGNAISDILEEIDTELLSCDTAILDNCMIAYEPRWSIWTWEVPTQQHIETVLWAIRTHIWRDDISLLYGGSVNEKNIWQIKEYAYVNGVLIGWASLEAERFAKICSV